MQYKIYHKVFMYRHIKVIFVSNCKTALSHKPTSRGIFSAEFTDLLCCVLKKGALQYMHTLGLLIMQGYHDVIHFSSPVYWERVAYLHVNSSCSLVQSGERGHLQGETGEEEEEEEEGDTVWGAGGVYSCFHGAGGKLLSLILRTNKDRRCKEDKGNTESIRF